MSTSLFVRALPTSEMATKSTRTKEEQGCGRSVPENRASCENSGASIWFWGLMFRSCFCVHVPPSLIVERTEVRSRAFSEKLW